VVLTPGERLATAQLSDIAGTDRFTVVLWVDPPTVAVMSAAPLAVNCVAVALNVAVVEPLPTVTDAGTGKLLELEDRFTVAPVGPLTVTVHVLVVPGPIVAGRQEMPLTVTGGVLTLTVPPVAVAVIPLPLADAPKALVSPMAAPLLPDNVTATVATTPSLMVVVFIPYATQI
jgi:hypothetical protein